MFFVQSQKQKGHDFISWFIYFDYSSTMAMNFL